MTRREDMRPPPGMTVRAAARARYALGGADTQALEGAITLTERERDAALARVAELEQEILRLKSAV